MPQVSWENINEGLPDCERSTQRARTMRPAPTAGVPRHVERPRFVREGYIPVGGVSAMLIFVVLLAVAFDYVNGFHDTANATITSVATRGLAPRTAILMATTFNFIGGFAGTAVAKTRPCAMRTSLTVRPSSWRPRGRSWAPPSSGRWLTTGGGRRTPRRGLCG